MDRLESMSILVSVVEHGSLSAASRKLSVPLASVSRKISELEAHLGTKLLNRTTRSLELTDSGRTYLAACTRILEQISEVERIASGEYSAPKGKLLITAPVVFGRLYIVPIVTEFLKLYPEIDVRLLLADRVLDMTEEHIDVAVRMGELPDSTMTAIRIGSIREVVCGSPAYFAKRGTPQTPKDLSKHDCITIDSLSSPASWFFPRGRASVSIPIRSRLTVSTVDAGLDAALSGSGIIRALSYQVARLEKAGKLKVILKDFESEPWPANLIYTGNQIIPLKLRAFLDFTAPRLKSLVRR
jgi:DNA-binding transcriptional LysR family regulator